MTSQGDTSISGDETITDLSDDPSIRLGKLLAHPKPGEEVVISGLSGLYPNSKNVDHFRDNLFNKVDLISDDNRRWEPGHPEIPHRTGKIFEAEKFDAGYFGIHHRQANHMDPMVRLLLEQVVNALFDAGINPSDLEGTNTGVFIGACFGETEKTWFYDRLEKQGYAITGCIRSMQAKRISYFLKLKGPSYVTDTACSSSLYAFEHAFRAIRTGQCDKAIVGSANLCLHAFVSLQFARLGVLSMDGLCKVFDDKGNGYVRSEAISVVILEKAKDAQRIYSTVLHAKTNCDGFKNSGITFPSKDMQSQLLKEFYEECDYVKPSDISYLEAHGTGTIVGDPEELHAIEEIYLKDRVTPLLIGSVKSNIGHCEPSSGVCSITKAIIAFETGFIPPNINFNTPRAGIKSFENGQLRVVTEKMPFNDNRGLIAINNFGFGGGNCHVLLKHNPKQKTKIQLKDNCPRLVCVSGRTSKAVGVLLDNVNENNLDLEHVGLLQMIFRKNVVNHHYRGYSVLSKSGEISRSCKFISVNKRALIICFGVIESETRKNAGEFLQLPLAVETIKRINEFLLTKKLDLSKIMVEAESSVLTKVLANFSLQIIFADILTSLNIIPDNIFGLTEGLSLGTLVCAYFDKTLTLKQAIECAYAIAYAANAVYDTENINVVDLAILGEKCNKVTVQLQKDLRNILVHSKTFSKIVITEATPSKFYSVYLTEYFNSNQNLSEVGNIIKKNSVMYKIGNGHIFNTLQEKCNSLNKNTFISTNRGLNGFLISVGRLYELGYNPQIQKLFPKVEFPLSRGTPMIASKICWNHDKDWWVSRYQCEDQYMIEGRNIAIATQNPDLTFLEGHVIDGRILFPAAGYLLLVWETLAYIHGLEIDNMNIVFENCRFKRACSVPRKDTKLNLTVVVQRGSGYFSVLEGDGVVVSGRIYQSNSATKLVDIPFPNKFTDAPSMTSKDIYKELRLRGYNYKDQFRALKSCDIKAQVGEITWNGNWVTFIDNMLQIKILQEDTRLLYVPTTIRRLTIDGKAHIKYVQSFEKENTDLPLYVCKETGTIRSGCIEIKGLNASSIAKRKYTGMPVLEKYVFVPNVAKLKTKQAIRVNMQILLENFYSIKVKAVELIEENKTAELEPLGSFIIEALADQPLIKPDVLTCNFILENQKLKGENKQLLTEVECALVVGPKILQRHGVLKLAFGLLKENGFILSRESLDFDITSYRNPDISVVTIFTTEEEKLIFCRQAGKLETLTAVRVSLKDKKFSWLTKLQNEVKNDHSALVYAEGEPLNGVLGLVACVRREPGGQKVKLMFLPDYSTPEFDIELPFYREQLEKNLVVNIFKNGQWGTYRHLLLERSNQVEVEHCYLNSLVRGDLSSLRWLEGPLSYNSPVDDNHEIISVYYSSLNFRDVMTATGRINADAITKDRKEQECVQGFEFAGRSQYGKRYMGMIVNGACASLVKANKQLLWEIPDNWSLTDAATIPVVYGTCLFAFFMKAKMRSGNSVLIHSGTGGIGQAAITLALYVGCTVYTTVGTPEKREFLKKKFPQLTDKSIANSRDVSFEQHIMKVTNGRGVDIVLNSLAEEKLLASVRCLARGGHFCEIGKFDLASDNTLNLLLLKKEVHFHGIMLDAFFNTKVSKVELQALLQEGIKSGAVQPLPRTIFDINQAEEAFRHMTSGKHIGKVLLQLRQEEKEIIVQPSKLTFPATPRYHCDSDKTYIICGGLGGFGLELADWLVLRGCMKLVLTSRSGIKTGYQAYRISIWKSYGCTVNISTKDITTKEGCTSLIKKANQLSPVHAIFNLAVVLKDAILENQTDESFEISFGPKAYATEYLDLVTRELCPELRDFVIFSSVSCGRGNAGQTNYGMANSIMERICEKRRSEGFPALAIEWGAVGDVGLVAELQDEAIEMEIGGTLQQRITNCLQCMDAFLKQTESAVVSSIVVAEKQAGAGGADNVVDAVADILGIKDLKLISLQATLAEVGMDSMTGVEIKQTLEREFEVYLTAQDIKTLTFGKLIEIQAERDKEQESGTKKERALIGLDMIYQQMFEASILKHPILPITGKISDKQYKSTLALFPGIEGSVLTLEALFKHLEANLVGLQYPNETQKDTIEDMANTYLPLIEEQISKSKPFIILCHSFGVIIALEVIHQLEKKGYKGTCICIDGAPDYLKALTTMLEVKSDDKLQVSLLVFLLSLQISYDVVSKHLETLIKCDDFEARLKVAQTIAGPNIIHSPEHQKACAISVYKRLKALLNWNPEFKLQSKFILFKPTLVSIDLKDEDYGLSKICEGPVKVKVFEGNHVTILENPEVSKEINNLLACQMKSEE